MAVNDVVRRPGVIVDVGGVKIDGLAVADLCRLTAEVVVMRRGLVRAEIDGLTVTALLRLAAAAAARRPG